MIAQSRCGLKCLECDFRLSHNCGGCIDTHGHPFHGECPIAKCCQTRGRAHCGHCGDLPCPPLHAYSYADPENGDHPPGARIDTLREWARLEPAPQTPPCAK